MMRQVAHEDLLRVGVLGQGVHAHAAGTPPVAVRGQARGPRGRVVPHGAAHALSTRVITVATC